MDFHTNLRKPNSNSRPLPGEREVVEEGWYDYQETLSEHEDDFWQYSRSELPFWPEDFISEEFNYGLYALWSDVVSMARTPWPALPSLPTSREKRVESPDELAIRLRQHLDQLPARYTCPQELLRRPDFAEALDDLRLGPAVFPEVFQWLEAHPGAGAQVLFLAPFWRQSMHTWVFPVDLSPDEQTISLLEHLFAEYPLPACLYQPWMATWHLWERRCLPTRTLPSFKWAFWLVLIGRGVSLHRASRLFDWDIPRAFQHHFLNAPADLLPGRACQWAEIVRLGGDPIRLGPLLRTEGYDADPTDIHRPRGDWELDPRLFWRDGLQWLLRYGAELNEAACEMVLRWAVHEQSENINFRLAGVAPPVALEAARAYEASFHQSVQDLDWKPKGWDFEHEDWSVRELTSARELRQEGIEMAHCVSGYAQDCWAGYTAIFSLCQAGQRCLTLEIRVASRRLVQARGLNNRPPKAEEKLCLARWRELVLSQDFAPI